MKTSALGLFCIAIGLQVFWNSSSWAQDSGSEVKHGVHPCVGLSLGYPAVVNGLVGVEATRIAVRLSGMYLNTDMNGVQLELGLVLRRTEEIRAELLVAAGTNRFEGWDTPVQTTSYLGTGLRLSWRGLFMIQGLTYEMYRSGGESSIGSWFVAIGFAPALR